MALAINTATDWRDGHGARVQIGAAKKKKKKEKQRREDKNLQTQATD